MQLLYADVIAIALGVAVHGLLPHRALTGAVLLPAVAGAATAVVWPSLVWLGVPEGSGWLWTASLLAAVLSSVVVGVVVRRRRHAADSRMLAAVARA